jgi:hypothetical protein
MSRIIPFPDPSRRTPSRTAMLDLMARSETAAGVEEEEFLEALRRIVAPGRIDAIWDRYPGLRRDRHARIFARYAD